MIFVTLIQDLNGRHHLQDLETDREAEIAEADSLGHLCPHIHIHLGSFEAES